MIKLTPLQQTLGCLGCWYFLSVTRKCTYKSKIEYGKYGKCLKRRKL